MAKAGQQPQPMASSKFAHKQQAQPLHQLKTSNTKQQNQNNSTGAKYVPPHKRPDGPKSPTSPLGGKRKNPPKLPSPTKALTRPPSPKEITAYTVPTWRGGSNHVQQRQVYRPQPVQMHPDTPFYSGAWLFDLGQAPTWLRIQLTSRLALPMRAPKIHSHLIGRIRLIGSKLNTAKHGKYQLPPIQLIFYKQPSPLPSFHYAQLMRPMTATDISEIDFLTGAWMFDSARVPLWMQLEMPQLATALVLRRRNRCSPSQRSNQSAHRQIKSRSAATHSARAMGQVIKCGSVKAANAHPDDAFFSGAWLFDESVLPQWLAAQLPTKRQVKQQAERQSSQSTMAKGQKKPKSARR
ncbi:hypothetical protein BCR44DRAFT_1515238 [Catenaria anguillulae PL171]|uniref:Uncharacterized protein n=1 Tax=Catenaria anguillulae PL171 TaxID=765915 RepID=A0A1Y2HFJ1_9FUNG|nr:hypothetical protein BCR44DRAFT_1515238 [Catenaria anguillulae PL171]